MSKIQLNPIGFVERKSPDENDKNRDLISKIVIHKDLANALDGLEDFSHIYIIFWMDRVKDSGYIHFPSKTQDGPPLGIFATRAPIHPNPVGLTLVELIKRKENVIWVKGLDALDGTPVIDIKPYPDWYQGETIIIDDYRVPDWIKKKKLNRD